MTAKSDHKVMGRYCISWLCGWHQSLHSAAVTSSVLFLQCIYGDTEEATQPWLNAWRSWTTTRLTVNCFLIFFFVTQNRKFGAEMLKKKLIFKVQVALIWVLSQLCRIHTWAVEKQCIVYLCMFFFFFIKNIFISLQEYLEFRKERAKMLISRRNQLLLEFSFWNEPMPRPGPKIYEMRTYHLKVSTYITHI